MRESATTSMYMQHLPTCIYLLGGMQIAFGLDITLKYLIYIIITSTVLNQRINVPKAHYAPVIGADLFLSIKLGRYY